MHVVAEPPFPPGDIGAASVANALQSLDREAERVITIAHCQAYRYASDVLASAHLLLGLLAVNPAPVCVTDEPVQCARTVASIRYELERIMGDEWQVDGPPRILHLPYTPHARAILVNAAGLGRNAEPAGTTPAHLWAALAAASGSVAARGLAALGLTPRL